MNKETEIKLRASRETLTALRDHPLLKKRSKDGWTTHELLNQYFDTADRDLARARVALRIRRDGEQFIQTLKSRGQSVAGLSERNEWDWYLDKPKLDPKKLTNECWPASLADLDKKQLKPLFTTDFVRQKTEIAWGRGKSKVVIEAALDLGNVIAGKQKEEICELELELRQGEPAALLELAATLAADLPLMPCDISKAERGYRLFDAGSYSLNLPQPALTPETTVDDAFTAIAWHLLGSSQRLAEQYRFNGHWKLLEDWFSHLQDLRALLSSVGQAIPRSSSHALRERLDALLNHWEPIVTDGAADEAIRHAAPARFAEELDNPRWGVLSLALSQWLFGQGWTVERNSRGSKQGKAPLESWLPRQLGEEMQALRLDLYAQRQPEDLGEQQPRLQRLLVWLRLARTVLEVEEADRLYGELDKLYALARTPIDETVLEARQQQALKVQSLKAWKALRP
ncbi:CYTH domain-containing protein [Pseudomonas matsuisoli]|uniref:Adenylate cyclase n=1 Tax=Pseudomonas matsuisoli TaxID=1515666 RepID=A0A917PWP7_9PSED|nr:inorganic triphosphatase [Pseudomonas matsuisoli]GGJ95253.1 adenylate cyclase [Pseudomonas matsuisoli]